MKKRLFQEFRNFQKCSLLLRPKFFTGKKFIFVWSETDAGINFEAVCSTRLWNGWWKKNEQSWKPLKVDIHRHGWLEPWWWHHISSPICGMKKKHFSIRNASAYVTSVAQYSSMTPGKIKSSLYLSWARLFQKFFHRKQNQNQQRLVLEILGTYVGISL